jgi:uncharacterized membrane protein
MSGTGFDILETRRPAPKRASLNQAMFFIIPSIVVTAVSIALFAQLTEFNEHQQNVFSITTISAIILSLVGMAGMQILIYRIVDDRQNPSDQTRKRGVRTGVLYAIIFSLAVSAVLFLYFQRVLHFSWTEYFYFSGLLIIFSLIWILSATFWAAEQYKYPAIIFSAGYLAIFAVTYGAYRWNSEYAMAGYCVGTLILLLTLWTTSARVFRTPEVRPNDSSGFSRIPKLISQNIAAILFSVFYVLAVFLDKIIIWVSQGMASGQGLLVSGPYTEGAFLGLIPMFSIAVVAYFTSRTKPLVEDRYVGTFKQIRNRVGEYKNIYRKSFGLTLLVAMGLFALSTSLIFFFKANYEVVNIWINISVGSIFFSGIIFNSMMFPIFGKTSVSTVAVLVLIAGECLSIPFVGIDIWFASLGFLVGTVAGFLVSCISVMWLFRNFERNMFRILFPGK